MSFDKRLVQIDLDQYIGDDIENFYNYLKKCLKSMDANIVCLQVATETSKSKGGKTANTLLFNPGEGFDIKVLDNNIYKIAASYIKAQKPECTILAWAPSLYSSFLTSEMDKDENNDGTVIKIVPGHEYEREELNYRRGSPFAAQTQESLKAFYKALGACSEYVDGILFQDDIFILDGEDYSSAGKDAIRNLCGVKDDNSIIKVMTEDGSEYHDEFPEKERTAAELYAKWQYHKVATLNNLTIDLFNAFCQGYEEAFPDRNKHFIKARDYFASSLINQNKLGLWEGQDINTGLDIYDYVVIMSYTSMSLSTRYHKEEPDSEKSINWLENLIKKAKNKVDDDRANKLILKLQSTFWDENESEDNFSFDQMIAQAKVLSGGNVANIGVYPGMQFDEENIFNNL